ncbi:MAG: hypothetical protein ACPGU5_02250 [Lishizhenia sp.]
MHKLILLGFLFLIGFSSAQKVDFVPNHTQFILSISGEEILNDVPLEKLEQYEYMAELSKELFRDASKPLSEFGFDLNGKFLFFGGDLPSHVFYGFSISVKDENKVLENMHYGESGYEALKKDGFYFQNSRLTILENNTFFFVEMDMHYSKVNDYVDSIYNANGWEDESYYYSDYYDEELMLESAMEEAYEYEEAVEDEFEIPPAVEKIEEEEIVMEEVLPAYPDRYLFRDSVEIAWAKEQNEIILADFLSENSLVNNHKKMRSALENGDQALFFFDASKFYANSYEFERELRYNPIIDKNSSLFEDQWYLARANFTENGILTEMDMHGHTEIMEVVDELGNSKFDKKMLQYIPSDNMGFVVGNSSYKEAYEKFKEIYLPKLESSADSRLQMGSALWYTWDRLINKDVLFELYSGRMFMSFNGFKEMSTSTISYEYDEETFEYKEVVTEGIETLPVFTAGLSTKETEIAEKYLEALCKSEGDFIHKFEDFYVLTKNEFNIPIYIGVLNDMFLISNDINVVSEAKNGGVAHQLNRKTKKRVKNSNMLYMEVDYAKLLHSIPREYVGRRDKEMFETMAGKMGTMNMSFSKVQNSTLGMKIDYTFNGDFENGGYYLLDLINTIYLKAMR